MCVRCVLAVRCDVGFADPSFFPQALDKLRTHTELAEIKESFEKLKSRNDYERKAVRCVV